ncbi:DUF4214 domain-containing protein [Xanthobacter sp. TB0136]|uniref:DUF4214 domain-containing protein n=1 Tax=Xanthobacter sp. TB0136 TaxID=3459177 RepID=UPI00403A1C4B
MALTSAQQITQLYVGYFNRAPDPEGLNYWIGRLDSGEMNVQQIAQSFSEQPETLATYPFLRYPNLLENDAEAFITEIYQNAFNRAPDEEGLAYWTEQLISGAVPVGDFIASVISGAQNTAAGQDLTTINNKTTVGLDYATQVAAANVDWTQDSAHAALEGVTDAQSTVVTAQANIVKFIETGAWPGSVGETFTLTTGVDNVIGTAANDTINGVVSNDPAQSPSTLNPLDSIDGGAGVNTLNLALVGANGTNVNLPNKATVSIQNIQNVNLVSADGAAATNTTTTVYNLPDPVTQNAAAPAIDARYFGSALEVLNQIDAANTVIHLQNGQTAAFTGDILSSANTTATAPGPLRAEFDGTEADVVLNVETLRNGRVALEVNGGKVETLTVSGNLGDGEGDLWLNTAASDAPAGAPATPVDGLTTSKLTTVNLNLESDGEIFLGRGALGVIAGVETIDASGSTGDLELDFATIATSLHVPGVTPLTPVAELALESLSFGSGNDTASFVLGSLTAESVSVDLGAGTDVFAVALGYDQTYGSASHLSITTGIGKDVLQFGELDVLAREVTGVNAVVGARIEFSGNVQLNAAGNDFVGSVTITDFDSANDTLQIAGFNGFTAQNLVDAALAAADINSLLDAVSAVADVVANTQPGNNITQFAQFVYEGNTYVYGDVDAGNAGLNGDLLIALTGEIDLNANNVTVFACSLPSLMV